MLVVDSVAGEAIFCGHRLSFSLNLIVEKVRDLLGLIRLIREDLTFML